MTRTARLVGTAITGGAFMVAAVAGASAPAGAHSSDDHHSPSPSPSPSASPSTSPPSATPSPSQTASPSPSRLNTPPPARGKTVYLKAKLNGGNEIPVPNGPAVGDPDARATAVIRIKGNEVCFMLNWERTSALSLGHIHAGAQGVNGPVRVGLFTSALPANLSGANGCTTVADSDVLAAIKANPANYYVNLHSTEFPGGAVRGQLKQTHRGSFR